MTKVSFDMHNSTVTEQTNFTVTRVSEFLPTFRQLPFPVIFLRFSGRTQQKICRKKRI